MLVVLVARRRAFEQCRCSILALFLVLKLTLDTVDQDIVSIGVPVAKIALNAAVLSIALDFFLLLPSRP